MRIAVSSYSFSQAMRDGRMNIFDVIPEAKRLGYAGVEIVRGAQSDAEMRALAACLKVQSEELDTPIIAYMVGADFIKNGLDAEVARLKREVEIAAIMGAPAMRHDSSAGVKPDGSRISVDDALPILAQGYRRVTEFAAGLGVKTMIENHGYFMQDSARVRALVERVNHPNFGWLADMGNFMCVGEDCVSAMETAAKSAVHAHIKDFHFKQSGEFVPRNQGWFGTRGGGWLRGAIIGHGCVDLRGCVELLKAAGYDGWLSVEFEGVEDCVYALKCDLENVKMLLGE